MGTPVAPEVLILLDKERHLRFDFNAAAKFEEATGKNLFQKSILTNMSATDMRAFLWSCLLWEDKDLTIEHVGAHITMSNLNDATDALVQVYTKNVPNPEGEKKSPLA